MGVSGDMKLSTRDLYRLRHTQMAAQRAALRAQHLEHIFRQLMLETERKYGFLGKNGSVDVNTGEIIAGSTQLQRETQDGFDTDANTRPTGPP